MATVECMGAVYEYLLGRLEVCQSDSSLSLAAGRAGGSFTGAGGLLVSALSEVLADHPHHGGNRPPVVTLRDDDVGVPLARFDKLEMHGPHR